MTSRGHTDLTELRAALRADAAAIGEALLGAPNKAASSKSTLRWGGKGAVALEIRGPKQGLWYSHEADAGSDMIGLIRHARQCSFSEAIAWAQQWTGIGPGTAANDDEQDARRRAQQDADRQARQAEQAAEAAKEAAGRVGYARRLWKASVPVAGTPAEVYLVTTRGIPASVWPDSAVRFHAPTNALIVAASLPDGSVQAVQRVFLTAAGTKIGPEELAARNLRAVKTTNGPLAGAVVRLPAVVTVDVKHGDKAPLMFAEGPETSLSVWAATGCEVWCALGSIAHIDASDSRAIIIAADDNPRASDEKHGAAARALANAMARWAGEGRDFRIAYPWLARRHDGSDFNDTIRAGGAAAVWARIDAAGPPEPPPPRRLPAYYHAATEPRDAALARQQGIIADTIRDGADRTAIRQEVRRRRDEEADRLELDGDEEVSPQKLGALTRRFTREVLHERGLTRMPKARRMLITGSQGSGKTRASLEEIAKIETAAVAWLTVPTLAKAEEAAADYRRLAGPNSMPVRVIRGRGAPDPLAPDEATKMCRRSRVMERLAVRGLPGRKLICPACPFNEVCGSLRQERDIASVKERGLFTMARAYLSFQSPAPPLDILVADERITLEAVDSVLSVSPDILISAVPFHGSNLGNVIDLQLAVNTLREILMKEAPLARLREDPVLVADLRDAVKAVEAAMEKHEPEISGEMSDNEILAILDELPFNNLGKVASVIRAVLRELPSGRDELNAVQFNPAQRVKVDGVEEEQPRILVYRLKMPRLAPTTLLLDGTGSAALNRILIPGLESVHIPIERDAHVTGTLGKSYSRQSVTGCDRYGDPINGKTAAAKRLRQELTKVATAMPGQVLLGATMGAIEAVRDDLQLPEKVDTAHFGAVRGLNTWEKCESVLVVGRESVSIENLESITRPFTATDPVQFTSFAAPPPRDWPYPTWPYRATVGRRMRDGTVQPVEVEVHPDPRAQAILEQIREAEILQTADRVRPIFNRRNMVLANSLVLDLTYDRVLSHAELVAGGTRWDRAWQAAGMIPLGAADLHKVHPDIFPSTAKAKELLADLQTNGGDLQIDSYLVNTPIYFRYRREGQRGKASRVAVDLKRHVNPKLTVEGFLGALVLFEPWDAPEPPNNPDPVTRPETGSKTDPLRDTPPLEAPPRPSSDQPSPWATDPGWEPNSEGLSASDLEKWDAQFANAPPPELKTEAAVYFSDRDEALLDPGSAYSRMPIGIVMVEPIASMIRLPFGMAARAARRGDRRLVDELRSLVPPGRAGVGMLLGRPELNS